MANKNFDVSNIKVIQAPLAGISDIVFRGQVRKYSSKCLITTEMISSEMLCNNPKARIIEFDKKEYPISFQLVGHKIEKMVKSAKILEPMASCIDINCGCPVKKVVVSGDGSAMMKTPGLAYDIVQAIKQEINLPVSAKFRLGWSRDNENYIEFAQTLQEAGIDFVTCHARHRSDLYQGHADWAKIKELVKNVDVPVFANGDIKTIEDTVQCLEITGAKGVSIGRGIMGDFTLPYRIEKYIESREIIEAPTQEQKLEMLACHLNLEVEYMGEVNGIKFMRKFYNYYINSIPNASKYRAVLVRADNLKDVLNVLNEIRKAI